MTESSVDGWGLVPGKRLSRDFVDKSDSWSLEFEVTVGFDAEVKSDVGTEVIKDGGEVAATDCDLVFGQSKDYLLLGGVFAPLPSVDPSQRKAFGSAVELGQGKAVMPVIVVAAPWLAAD